MISIIMPAYNAAKSICAAIASVSAQTYPGWELLIIDDNSTDVTPRLARFAEESDSRIRVLSNETNRGAAESRNYGIREAKGEILAFLDSDDKWAPDKLEKQLRFMEETGAVISYTATAYIYEGERSDFVLHAEREFSYRDLLRRNLMSCSSVMVRRDIMPFFSSGNLHEDYVAWLKILKPGPPNNSNNNNPANSNKSANPNLPAGSGTSASPAVKLAYGLDEPLLLYNIAADSKSGGRVKSGIMVYNSYREFGYGQIASLLMTLRYAVHSISKRTSIRQSRE